MKHSFISSAVIKMEGGTDHDLRILDLTAEEEEEKSALGAGEPPKRELPKGADGDRKALMEKDKNEKVGCVFCLASSASFECSVVNKVLHHRKRTTLQSHREEPRRRQMGRKRRDRKKAPKRKCLR